MIQLGTDSLYTIPTYKGGLFSFPGINNNNGYGIAGNTSITLYVLGGIVVTPTYDFLSIYSNFAGIDLPASAYDTIVAKLPADAFPMTSSEYPIFNYTDSANCAALQAEMGTMRFTIGDYWFDIPASAYIIDFGANADNTALPLFGADKCVFMFTKEYYTATQQGAIGLGNAWMW